MKTGRPRSLAPRQHPEKRVEAECMEALRRMGFGVVKTSQPQRAVGMTKGIPDLYARRAAGAGWPEMRLWVEVKAGRNGPSADQVAWHAAERAAGGIVVVVWSVADLIRELKALGAPVT